MNISYNKRIAFIVLSLFVLYTIPVHSFWGQHFCTRVSAAFLTFSNRVKNNSVTKRISSLFSKEKIKNASAKTVWASSVMASCASVACLHEDIRNRVFGIKKVEQAEPDKKTKIKTKGGYKDREYLTSLRTGRNNRDNLAMQVLEHLDIPIDDDLESPIPQIKNLTPQQQDAAFDYLMDIFEKKEDTNTLPTIYSIMEHLEKPKKEYKKFFETVGANIGECHRSDIIGALIWQYYFNSYTDPLPSRLKAKFGEIGYNEAMDLWWKRKPLPEWLVVMRDKIPCEKEDLARKKAENEAREKFNPTTRS